MNTRSIGLLKIRPDISGMKVSEDMSVNEKFQNTTLRPIIKFQDFLLVAMFRNHIAKHKNSFYKLTLEQRFEYIENAVQRDLKLRNALKGIIIGHFTAKEFETYTQNSSALNKRMMQMVIDRLKDRIQLLDIEVLL